MCGRLQKPQLTVAWLQERRQVVQELSGAYLRLAEFIRDSARDACLNDADEAFADIAGVDIPTWHESVEEYKRRLQDSSGA